MHAAIFLDRDGVLIENRSDYVLNWSQVRVLPEAIHALSVAAIRDYKIVIVTNQSAVGRGLISLETAADINNRLVSLIHHHGGHVDAVYMCPHKPEEDCPCRKPKPGLLLRAAQELSLDLQRSWMIGDAWSDVWAGHSAGVRQSILLTTGRGREQLLEFPPENPADCLICDTLPNAIDVILAADGTSVVDA